VKSRDHDMWCTFAYFLAWVVAFVVVFCRVLTHAELRKDWVEQRQERRRQPAIIEIEPRSFDPPSRDPSLNARKVPR